jgi:protein-S-isoprenylcysteine O-methyltransferase Ste14
MLLNSLENEGNYFFKNRSWIPLVFFILVIPFLIFQPNKNYDYNNLIWVICCFIVSILGLITRIFVVGYVSRGTSGRNTQTQIAECINQTGLYSITRHPLYIGNLLMWVGIIMYAGNFSFAIFTIVCFLFYYERIMFAEEMFLQRKFGEQYINYANSTPILPYKLRNYKKPNLSFSVKKAIKYEYLGFTSMMLSFVFVNILLNYVQHKLFHLDTAFLIILISTISLFCIIRLLVKETTLFQEEGR